MTSQKDILLRRLRTLDRTGLTDEQVTALKTAGFDVNTIKALGGLESTFNNLEDSLGGTEFAVGRVFDRLNKLGPALETISKSTNFYEQRGLALSKALNISSQKGADLRNQLSELGKTLTIGGEQAAKYTIAVEKQFTGLGKIVAQEALSRKGLQRDLILSNQILTEQYGLTEESAGAFLQYSLQSNQSIEKTMIDLGNMALHLEKTTGETGLLAEMFDELSKVGATNSTIFGKYPSQLAIAAMAAKRLGTSFDSIAGAARGALNIEQSIGAEMEYQLLTGQKINKGNENLLNTLRLQYLTGADPTAMAKTYTSIFETQGDYIRNNVVAGEALAKTMGIGTDELYKQLRAYDARKALLEQIDQPDILALVESGDLEGLQKKLDAGEIVGKSQVNAIKDFLAANHTLEDSTMLLKRSLDTLNGTVVKYAKLLSPGITDVAARKEEALEGGDKLKPAIEELGQYLVNNQEGTELVGTGLLAKEILSSILTAVGVKNPFQDFILRPGQAPISFRKDDILRFNISMYNTL